MKQFCPMFSPVFCVRAPGPSPACRAVPSPLPWFQPCREPGPGLLPDWCVSHGGTPTPGPGWRLARSRRLQGGHARGPSCSHSSLPLSMSRAQTPSGAEGSYQAGLCPWGDGLVVPSPRGHSTSPSRTNLCWGPVCPQGRAPRSPQLASQSSSPFRRRGKNCLHTKCHLSQAHSGGVWEEWGLSRFTAFATPAGDISPCMWGETGVQQGQGTGHPAAGAGDRQPPKLCSLPYTLWLPRWTPLDTCAHLCHPSAREQQQASRRDHGQEAHFPQNLEGCPCLLGCPLESEGMSPLSFPLHLPLWVGRGLQHGLEHPVGRVC